MTTTYTNTAKQHQNITKHPPVSVLNTLKLLSQNPQAMMKRESTVVTKQLLLMRTFWLKLSPRCLLSWLVLLLLLLVLAAACSVGGWGVVRVAVMLWMLVQEGVEDKKLKERWKEKWKNEFSIHEAQYSVGFTHWINRLVGRFGFDVILTTSDFWLSHHILHNRTSNCLFQLGESNTYVSRQKFYTNLFGGLPVSLVAIILKFCCGKAIQFINHIPKATSTNLEVLAHLELLL